MDNLALSLLGTPHIECGGRPVELERHKALALLVFLAVTGTIHRRDELAALFWPELDQTRARAALRRTLSTLNISLPGDWLQTDRETIGLSSPVAFSLDLTRFHDLLELCRNHGHLEVEVCFQCLENLNSAASLYRGDFLSGFTLRDSPAFDDWQFFQTESLRRELAGVLERLANGHAARREYDAAINHARRWLALDPMHEPAVCQLMRLYAWSGERHAALRQYTDCVRILERELGIPPQEATTELYNAIKEGPLPQPPAEFPILAAIAMHPTKEVFPYSHQKGVYKSVGDSEKMVDSSRDSLLDRTMRSNFVGQERELEDAGTLWSRAVAGDGKILFISGEPGVGKTRFVQELVGLAQNSGGRVLMDGCHAEGGPPYAPLAGMIRSTLEKSSILDLPEFVLADLLTLAPHLRSRYPNIQPNPPLDLGFEQQRVFDSFVAWCELLSAHVPLLMVVEDVQWSDVSTIALLHNLARRVHKVRLLLVMTYRDTEVELDQGHPLNPLLLDLNRERLSEHIKLLSLSHSETRDLLAGMLTTTGEVSPEFLDSVYRETEGNPFFVEEVCKGLIEQGKLYHAGGIWRRADMHTIFIPPNVRHAILARFAFLPSPAQEALRLAAILGREFDFDILHGLSGQDEEALGAALEKAEQAQWIGELSSIDHPGGPITYSFTHALIPFALRESMGGLRLQQLHHRAGTVVENLHPGDVESLAYHFTAAGKRDKAIEYSRRAAEKAMALYAYDTAIEFLQPALNMIEAGGQIETHLAILESIADAHKLGGNLKVAISHYQEALGLLKELPFEVFKWTIVRLHRKVGETFNYLGKDAEMEKVNVIVLSGFERALKLIENEPPHQESVRLLTTVANYGYWSANQHYAQTNTMKGGWEQYAHLAVDMAERLDEPMDLSAALAALAGLYGIQGMLRERLQLTFRLLDLSRDPRFTDQRERVGILCMVGLALCSIGEFDKALHYLIEAEQLADQVRDLDQVIYALEIQAQCLLYLDRWDEVALVEEKGPALKASYGKEESRRICRQCGVSAYIHGLRGEMELSRSHREAAYNMMASAWGPLENWPSIGHF